MELQKTRNYKTLKILFGVYLIAITWIILFQFSISNLDNVRSINLIPFKGALIINGHIALNEIIWNVIIFAPYGIYLCVLFKEWSFCKKTLVFLGTSLLYEVL